MYQKRITKQKKLLEKASKKKTLEYFQLHQKKGYNLNSILIGVDCDLLDNSNVLLTLEQLVDYGIISLKLSAGKMTQKLPTILWYVPSNPKQSQQDKCSDLRQDLNNKNENPSNNIDILVHLSDINDDINSAKNIYRGQFF